MTVLDLGCGPGRVTVPAAKRIGPQGTVVAMDIQEGMLQRAREKAVAAGASNIVFRHAGAGEGKLETSHFDRALLVTVLGEIPDREAVFKELFEALKPGGILSITEVIFDPHYQRRSTVSRLAKVIGFCEAGFFGNAAAYTLNLEKPRNSSASLSPLRMTAHTTSPRRRQRICLGGKGNLRLRTGA